MSTRTAAAACCWVALTFAGVVASGCSVDEGANASRGCEGCEGRCVKGFCVPDDCEQPDDGGSTDGAGPTGTDAASPDAGDSGGRTSTDDAGADDAAAPECSGDDTMLCFSADMAKATVGRCKAGQRSCVDGFFGDCLGEVVPTAEMCNGEDDDCDGATDEDVAPATCDTGEDGLCAAGTTTCSGGAIVCVRDDDPIAETCNGDDDDCDGSTDEDSAEVCYPGGSGCTGDAMVGFDCDGICAAGERACVGGALQACAGATTAMAMEQCGGGLAADDDCDGTTDEGCSCTNMTTQDCYSGPAGTDVVGTCMKGTQTCTGGAWGACAGEVAPEDETCLNETADNDCNGDTDDVPGRGDACTVASSDGVCRDGVLDCESGSLQCQTPVPGTETCNGKDDDCDGDTDEEFNLQQDENNCGSCGMVCAGGETCCGGDCVDLDDDKDHCGACGAPCGTGLTCCGGMCKDTTSDADHCGSCGNDCAALQCCKSSSCSSICL